MNFVSLSPLMRASVRWTERLGHRTPVIAATVAFSSVVIRSILAAPTHLSKRSASEWKRWILSFWILSFVAMGSALAAHDVLHLTEDQVKHLGIRTAKLESVVAMPLAQAPGRVVLPPENEFVVSAPEAGLIGNVGVALGVPVIKGQVLAQLQSPDILDIQRQVLSAAAEFDLAQARLARDQALLREGIISRLRWQETKSEQDKAQASLGAAEQTLAAAGFSPTDIKNLKSSHVLNSRIEVRSPVHGVILERMAVVGQRVELLAPLFRIGRLERLWLEVDMPQERLHEIALGDKIRLDDPPALARVIEIGQNIDPSSQSTLVRAVVEEGIKALRPGMQVNVQLMHKSTDRLVRLPVSALVRHEGKSYVFVKNAAEFTAQAVKVAGQDAYRAVIHEGLENASEVVVQGVAGLKATWLGLGADK